MPTFDSPTHGDGGTRTQESRSRSDSPATGKAEVERRRRKIRLASLEADVSYFQARLEILGEPVTVNQQAQRKAYKHLCKGLGEQVRQSKRELVDGDSSLP